MAGSLAVCGITKTGLLPFTDCKTVPLHGAVAEQFGGAFKLLADAPMPMIFSALRSVTWLTVYV